MQEAAFYERLQEAFNDILLTRGYDGVAEGALSYEHFKTRLWYQDVSPRKGLSPEKQKELKAKKKAESDRYERIVKRLRIKGIEASTDHRDNCTVVMTAGASEIVAARAGVSLV